MRTPGCTEDQDWRDIKATMTWQDGLWSPPMIAYGALDPFNILVYGSKLLGIVNSEIAGWYLPYWEYTSAC